MNPNDHPLDVRQFLQNHLTEVFDTMLSLPAEVLAVKPATPNAARVTGSVGFGGDRVTGALYLHLAEPFALRCACAMLGLTPPELNPERDVNDVVGEVTNMLAGGLKSALCDAGRSCAVSTPAIIRGTAYEVETLPDVRRELLFFRSGEDPVIVEVHIKYN